MLAVTPDVAVENAAKYAISCLAICSVAHVIDNAETDFAGRVDVWVEEANWKKALRHYKAKKQGVRCYCLAQHRTGALNKAGICSSMGFVKALRRSSETLQVQKICICNAHAQG